MAMIFLVRLVWMWLLLACLLACLAFGVREWSIEQGEGGGGEQSRSSVRPCLPALCLAVPVWSLFSLSTAIVPGCVQHKKGF
jgi:hypothetical protein